MPARLTLRDQEYEVRSGMTIRDALLKIGIQPETVIPTREGELVTDDELLEEGEHIRLVAVISGGAFADHHQRTTSER
jgi:sulfur carrier protein ThiS